MSASGEGTNQFATNATMTISGGSFELRGNNQEFLSLDVSGGLIHNPAGPTLLTLNGEVPLRLTGGEFRIANLSLPNANTIVGGAMDC